MLAFLPFTLLIVVLDALTIADARSSLVNLQRGEPLSHSLGRRDVGIEEAAISNDRA